MGGKSYYCNYCHCYLKNDVNLRKMHNDGLSHKIAKTNYMRRFDDPRKVLAEESAKAPCSRYLGGGYCKFDLYCQYRHYSEKQMQQLRQIVSRLERQSRKKRSDQKIVATWCNFLPWRNVGDSKSKRKRDIKKLPQSLKPIKLNKITDDCFKSLWG